MAKLLTKPAKILTVTCEECGETMYRTPSGMVCENGHGGAEADPFPVEGVSVNKPLPKALKVEVVPINSVKPHPRNVRVHPEENIKAIMKSLETFGMQTPIVVNNQNEILKGNGTHEAMKRLGKSHIQVIRSNLTLEMAEAYGIVDNKTGDMSHFDTKLLAQVMKDIEGKGIDLEVTGFQTFEREQLFSPQESGQQNAGALQERFGVPPFSVLDARQGYWQDRKRAWLALGIQSELGRGGANPGGSPRPATKLGPNGKTLRGDGVGKAMLKSMQPKMALHNDPMQRKHKYDGNLTFVKGNRTEGLDNVSERILDVGSGTSIFDPVLCELVYRWFCPKGGIVLDPFAGGSVRGIVAGYLGREYHGVDLRSEQVQANRKQLNIVPEEYRDGVQWMTGDSAKTVFPGEFDLLFTCPPYGDLEVYSDDPADISNMDAAKFDAVLGKIIFRATRSLKENAFAVIVVGDYRDKKTGIYHNFPGRTIWHFQNAGMELYNEAILVTAVGSLPLRAGKQFNSSRKLGKTHQNVLVFVKGDPKLATDAVGEVEIFDLNTPEENNEDRNNGD